MRGGLPERQLGSQPGLGPVLAARVLGEFGDDPTRFASSRARKNYSGQSPITRASGKKTVVLARYATNRRLGVALHLQAYGALNESSGSRTYYDAIRARGTSHHAALRQVANRLVGILHGCLASGTPTTKPSPGTLQQSLRRPRRDPPLDNNRHGMSAKSEEPDNLAGDLGVPSAAGLLHGGIEYSLRIGRPVGGVC